MTVTERRREHEENHVRTVDQQMLDALLRIEERLITLTAIVHYDSLPVAYVAGETAAEVSKELERVATKPDAVVKAKNKPKSDKYL